MYLRRVVPANAGTHNHGECCLEKVSASVPKRSGTEYGPGVRRDDGRKKPARAAHHGLEIIIRLDDLDQAILGGAVAAIGVGMVLLHQRLVLRLDGFQRRVRPKPHHLQRLALGVHDFPRFRLGLASGAARTRPPAATAVELGEHAERIGRTFQLGFCARLALLAAVGAHLPGRAMAGQRVLLVARDGIRIHSLEEIIGLVVFADVIEAEVKILPRVLAALGRAVRTLVRAPRPFAHGGFFARLRLLLRAQLVGLDANGIEEFG